MSKNQNFLKFLDMYGQPVQFSYKGSTVFSSSCGICTSVIAIVLIFAYSLLLLLNVLSHKNPRVFQSTESMIEPPKYYLMSDVNGLFNQNSSIFNVSNEEVSIFQMSFLLSQSQKDNKPDIPIPIDPRYYFMKISSIETKDGVQNEWPLYFETCKRFPHSSKTFFDYYNLNRSYCLYSPITTEGHLSGKKSNRVVISFEFCRNNTFVYLDKEKQKEYQRLKYLYEINKKNISDYKKYYQKYEDILPLINGTYNQNNAQQTNTTNTNNNSSNNLPKNMSNEDLFFNVNPHVVLKDSVSDKNLPPLVCATPSEIVEKLRYSQLIIYFSNTYFNRTFLDKSISFYVDNISSYFSHSLLKNMFIYFQNNKILTSSSLLPASMVDTTSVDYLMNIDTDTIERSYGEVDVNYPFFVITLNSYQRKTSYERKYVDIFEILGLIGGLSKVIIMIGAFFVYFVINTRMKESLINDFYSVIDPTNLIHVSKDFKQYLTERIAHKRKSNSEATILEEYFTFDLVEKLVNLETDSKEYKKYEIIYEVFKHRAYAKLRYSYFEIFANYFCCCIRTKRLVLKNKTYLKACQQLENDTDFVSIIKSVQEFDNLKKTFLDEGQLNLFQSIVNEEITAAIAEENEKIILERKKKKREIHKKKFNTDKISNNNEKDEENLKNGNKETTSIISSNYQDYKNMQKLQLCLEAITNEDRIFDEVDMKLLNNLIDSKEIIKSFIGNRIQRKKNEETNDENQETENNNNNNPPEKLPELTAKDIREINRKFLNKNK